MAKLIKLVEAYEFTEPELRAAQLLSEGNVQFIKTQIAMCKQARENMQPDPNNYAAFIQEEAENKGAQGAYQFLLDRHQDVIDRLSTDPQEPIRG